MEILFRYLTMKQLNIVFDDGEYKKLRREKEKSDLSWHDFILKLLEGEV